MNDMERGNKTVSNHIASGYNYDSCITGGILSTKSTESDVSNQLVKLDSEWHDLNSLKSESRYSLSTVYPQDTELKKPFRLVLGSLSQNGDSMHVPSSGNGKETKICRKTDCQLIYEMLFKPDSSDSEDM